MSRLSDEAIAKAVDLVLSDSGEDRVSVGEQTFAMLCEAQRRFIEAAISHQPEHAPHPDTMPRARLVAAVRNVVADDFEHARGNEEHRTAAQREGGVVPFALLWCDVDALNPCWSAPRPVTWPLRHWGWTEGDESNQVACECCQLRAALHEVTLAEFRP